MENTSTGPWKERIEYLGTDIWLTADPKYFDVCENEDITLDPVQAKKAETALLRYRFPSSITSEEALTKLIFELKFIGYGMSTRSRAQDDGSELLMVDFEIPCRQRERVVVLEKTAGPYYLLDDFV